MRGPAATESEEIKDGVQRGLDNPVLPLIRNRQRAPGQTTWRLRRQVNTINTNAFNPTKGVETDLRRLRNFFKEKQSVRCMECDGWGHTAKKCPTREYIINYCKGQGAMQTFVNQSRKDIFESHGVKEFRGKTAVI